MHSRTRIEHDPCAHGNIKHDYYYYLWPELPILHGIFRGRFRCVAERHNISGKSLWFRQEILPKRSSMKQQWESSGGIKAGIILRHESIWIEMPLGEKIFQSWRYTRWKRELCVLHALQLNPLCSHLSVLYLPPSSFKCILLHRDSFDYTSAAYREHALQGYRLLRQDIFRRIRRSQCSIARGVIFSYVSSQT